MEDQLFKKCPKCVHSGGFYIRLKSSKSARQGNFVVKFECPKCHNKFQIGLILDKKKSSIKV